MPPTSMRMENRAYVSRSEKLFVLRRIAFADADILIAVVKRALIISLCVGVGCLKPMTLWEHDADRAQLRAANHRSSIDKVALRREISAIADAAKLSKLERRDAVRRAHATAAIKPYASIIPGEAPANRAHPVNDYPFCKFAEPQFSHACKSGQ